MRGHSANFSRHYLARPTFIHGRTRRKLSTTRYKGVHHQELLVIINDDTLDLKLNILLLSQEHVVSLRKANRTTLHRHKVKETELCHYTGHLVGRAHSWAAVSTCYGLRGAIHDGDTIRYVEPVRGNSIHSWHHVYEQSSADEGRRCGHDDLQTYEQLMEQGRKKRDDTIRKRGFFNANQRSRYVELVLVADHAQYLGAGRNLRVLMHQLQETTNIANAMFSPHNVFIALTGVEVWTAGDRINLNRNSQITLKEFSAYLPVLLKTFGHYDHVQLITDTHFLNGHIGLSYVGSMCFPDSCSIVHRSSRDVTASTIVRNAFSLVHEIGHSFGMVHDTENCVCPDRDCIMTEREPRILPTRWSNCSLKVLSDNFVDLKSSSCLRNKPNHLFGPPSCGNGFIDSGEECDCGFTMSMRDDKKVCYMCCDPETCLLKPNTTCVEGGCCDLEVCQYKPAGSICRAAELECDLPEYCDGASEYCPEDVYKIDSVPCIGKLCEKQQCIVVDDSLVQIIRHRSKGCIANCSGHGVCNSKGHCHCDPGFLPPMSDQPDFGSVDPGPISTKSSYCPESCACFNFNDMSDRDKYFTALTSLGFITAIMLFIMFGFVLKMRYASKKKKKCNLKKIRKNFGFYDFDSTEIDDDENVQRKVDTPCCLSHMKIQRIEEYMKMIREKFNEERHANSPLNRSNTYVIDGDKNVQRNVDTPCCLSHMKIQRKEEYKRIMRDKFNEERMASSSLNRLNTYLIDDDHCFRRSVDVPHCLPSTHSKILRREDYMRMMREKNIEERNANSDLKRSNTNLIDDHTAQFCF